MTAEPLAILGGTFDPVHFAHLRCADEVREKLGLETAFLLPGGNPPHRMRPQASNRQRLEMLQLAILDFPHLQIDRRELDREGPSYMIDTLQDLRKEFPGRPVVLVIGQDAANHLHSWHRWQALFDLAHIVVMTRPGVMTEYQPELAKQFLQRECTDVAAISQTEAGHVLALEVTAIDICATTIQSMLRLGRSPRTMLPAAVLDYIFDQGLYLKKE